ncbi:MAG: quinone-dependent dihydroorotate dehydrogenase [Rhizomicrobium sp.]
MISLFDHIARPLLRVLDPEDAHGLTMRALKYAPLRHPQKDDPLLATRAFGLTFPNPVGLAAGFDKHAEAPIALLRLGFGFVEVGTITPRPQPGNPRPRLFRLNADEGVINRYGFNSEGAAAAFKRLTASGDGNGVIGVNVGVNKDTEDRGADYVRLIESFAAVASYFTVNVSSPNTPGLRDLQRAAMLDDLLARVIAAHDRVARIRSVPVLLKIAPDLTLSELDDVVGVARRRKVDGMIVGNTTLSRPPTLRDIETARESGGLSGRPLFPLATRMLAETYVRTERAFPLIGVGGIDSPETALAKFRAGASLIQLYSGLVFRGIGLVADIKAGILRTIAGKTTLSELVGDDAASITAEPWPH